MVFVCIHKQVMQLKKINRAIIFLPCIWIALLWIFAALVSIRLGHLPANGLPDPKDSGLGLLYFFVISGLGLIIFIMPLSFVIQLVFYCLGRSLCSVKMLAGQILSFILFIGYLKFDLFGLFEWLSD